MSLVSFGAVRPCPYLSGVKTHCVELLLPCWEFCGPIRLAKFSREEQNECLRFNASSPPLEQASSPFFAPLQTATSRTTLASTGTASTSLWPATARATAPPTIPTRRTARVRFGSLSIWGDDVNYKSRNSSDPNILPSPLPQPVGCRADTQIVCPGKRAVAVVVS